LTYNPVIAFEENAMTSSLVEVEEKARSLPAEDRARLVEILLESLAGGAVSEIDAAWRREIEDRVASYDRGEVATHAAEDVFAEATRIGR
jgi:putative addiction module component (TIGR02574 family)